MTSEPMTEAERQRWIAKFERLRRSLRRTEEMYRRLERRGENNRPTRRVTARRRRAQ